MGKTSWQVKARYNNKVYGSINIKLPKQLVADFKNLCHDLNKSQASVIKEFIKEFLKACG